MFSHLARFYSGKEKKRKRRRKKKKEKGRREEEKIKVWNSCLEVWNLYGNFLCDIWNFGIGTIINLSLSKLCRKNPIRSVVGWYKMSFMVYFEFSLSWFWFGRKFR